MGETVLQLAEKVMRNVAAYRQMAGPPVGWWYGVKAKLTAATTAEEVMAGGVSADWRAIGVIHSMAHSKSVPNLCHN